jgi:peptidyl-prolyl cis-trans isomerase C
MAKQSLSPRSAVLFCLISLMLVSCGRNVGAEKPPQPGDVVVARINKAPIWTSDVKQEAIAQGLIGQGEPLDMSSDVFRRVLDEVIDQKLLSAEAIKRKIDRNPDAQRRLAAARERILGDLLVESVVEKAVSEPAIQGLYREQVRLSKQSEELRARQIIVASLADAQAIRKQLASGTAFDSLAIEKSTDAATRFNGGDLGYFTLDVMPATYAAALKDAKVGDLIGPFAIESGFAVLKLEDRRQEKPLALDVARPQIVRFLTYDQVRSLIETLRNGAKIATTLPAQPAMPGSSQEPSAAPPSAEGATPADPSTPSPDSTATPAAPADKPLAPAVKAPAPVAKPATPGVKPAAPAPKASAAGAVGPAVSSKPKT